MKSNFYSFFTSAIAHQKKLIAVLIDPDKFNIEDESQNWNLLNEACDIALVGGSILTLGSIDETVKLLKTVTTKPIFLFPGNAIQISNTADGIFLLSLISGRNPDFLIGQHVISAPLLKKSNLEIIPTGYILVEGGQSTSVSYISNTTPIPSNKPDIAACTAIAGELLGLKQIYLEAGSGSLLPVNIDMIEMVKKNTNIPLIVGGGLNSIDKINSAFNAGADMVVVGSIIEENTTFLKELAAYKSKIKSPL